MPTNPEDQASYWVSNASSSISKNDSQNTGHQIASALDLPTGGAKVRELFASQPKGREYYKMHIEKDISRVSSIYQANSIFQLLTTTKNSVVFPENQIAELFDNLRKKVIEGNISGLVPVDLSDNLSNFPELKSAEHQRVIIDRSIKNLQGNGSGSRLVAALIEYVQRVGVNSVEGKRIESLLPTMNIRRDELDVVAKVFPTFAVARKNDLTAQVFIQIKNADRLVNDDLMQVLRHKVRGVEWVPSAGAKTTTVVIERVRNDEKTLPERTQTITYATHEVNLLGAVLLMPRNASYLYDVVSGGAEIEYGYVVSAIVDGKTIHDEVIRGKVGGEYNRCQNARIQNVFGGVSSAGFVANDDMQRRCNNSSSAVSMEDLRKDIFSKVVDSVLKIPPIQVVHDLN